MHRDITKGNTRAIMRRIKQQWGAFTDDDIAEIHKFYEEQSRKQKLCYRSHKAHIRNMNN